MRRREFITLLGGATVAWPLASGAQQQTMPLVGFLNGQTAAGYTHLADAFKQGLNESGFVEGQNVTRPIKSTRYCVARSLPNSRSNSRRNLILSSTERPPKHLA